MAHAEKGKPPPLSARCDPTYNPPFQGQVTERLKVQHWKCCVRFFRTVGSNPTLSVAA